MSIYMAVSLFMIFACGIYFLVMGMTDIISHNPEKQITAMTDTLSHKIEEKFLKKTISKPASLQRPRSTERSEMQEKVVVSLK